jgi:serpin B
VKCTVASILCGLTFSLVASMSINRSSAAEPSKSKPKLEAVANASNQFAFELYGKLSAEKGNLFFSPCSISTALGMVYAGAKGETAEQMAKVLAIKGKLEGDALHTTAGELIRQLNAGGKQGPYQLTVANRLWGQQGFKFLDSFLNVVRKNYDAGLEQLNFAQAEAARKTVNTWVEKATNEKIKDLIPPGAINGDTRLVLTNAVYFKGTWQDVFKSGSTRAVPFFISGGAKVDVPTMHQSEHFEFGQATIGESMGLKILKLPYKCDPQAGGKCLSMVLLLPDDVSGLSKLEKQLTAFQIQQWLTKLHMVEVIVALPKFKLMAQFELSDVLSELGMPQAFDVQKADFSGMDGRRDLFLSAVFHKAFVDVNEEGTEAAAATGAAMAAAAMPVRENPQEFRADHPFIFLIRDEATGCILFIGRITDPR